MYLIQKHVFFRVCLPSHDRVKEYCMHVTLKSPTQ